MIFPHEAVLESLGLGIPERTALFFSFSRAGQLSILSQPSWAVQGNFEGSRRFKKVQEGSRRFKKVQEGSRV